MPAKGGDLDPQVLVACVDLGEVVAGGVIVESVLIIQGLSSLH